MRYPLGVALLCALALPVVSAAQTPAVAPPAADTGSLAGVVHSDARQPVEGARVRDAATGRFALTDRDGRFQLRGLPSGRRVLDVMAIGYGMTTGEVEVFAASRTELAITLLPLPPLDTVFVNVAGPRDAPRELLDHIREGVATRIFTSQEIAQRAPVYTTQLLTLVPGVRVVGTGPRASIVPGRGSGGTCTRVYLDGYPVRGDEINSVAPSTLAGVEFYYATNAPPQYMRGGACAVVLLWTKVRRTAR